VIGPHRLKGSNNWLIWYSSMHDDDDDIAVTERCCAARSLLWVDVDRTARVFGQRSKTSTAHLLSVNWALDVVDLVLVEEDAAEVCAKQPKKCRPHQSAAYQSVAVELASIAHAT